MFEASRKAGIIRNGRVSMRLPAPCAQPRLDGRRWGPKGRVPGHLLHRCISTECWLFVPVDLVTVHLNVQTFSGTGLNDCCKQKCK